MYLQYFQLAQLLNPICVLTCHIQFVPYVQVTYPFLQSLLSSQNPESPVTTYVMKATKIISGLRRHSSYFISVLLIHNTLQEKVAAEQKVDNSAQLIQARAKCYISLSFWCKCFYYNLSRSVHRLSKIKLYFSKEAVVHTQCRNASIENPKILHGIYLRKNNH